MSVNLAVRLRRRLSALRSSEEGSGGGLTLVVLLIVVALFMVFGLVVDGGVRASAVDRANRVAMEAARAGAQAITEPGAGGASVDQVVQQYLATEGISGISSVNGDRVDVSVGFSEPTKILGIIGITDMPIHGSGFAYAIYDAGGAG